MGKILVTSSLIFLALCASAQSTSYYVDVINSWNILTHAPSDTSVKRPAIIFFPGNNQTGSDTAEGAKFGPIYQFRNGWDGTARGDQFWVFHVQPSSPTYTESQYRTRVAPLIAKHPSIDTNRIYFTGLSLGGVH